MKPSRDSDSDSDSDSDASDASELGLDLSGLLRDREGRAEATSWYGIGWERTFVFICAFCKGGAQTTLWRGVGWELTFVFVCVLRESPRWFWSRHFFVILLIRIFRIVLFLSLQLGFSL
jgi:hypothetical protein